MSATPIDVDLLVAPEDPCSDAEELLTKLAPHHPDWKSEAQQWIYRGQGRDLPLLAAVHRDDPKIFEPFGVGLTPEPNESDRFFRDRIEDELLSRFETMLERSGFQVPPERHLRKQSGQFIYNPQEPEGTRALAQHLGVPTSLLDWTTQSLKAAYFAAASAAKKPDAGTLVVWALRREPIDSRMTTEDFAIVTPAPWANPNLFAQAGTFTRQKMFDIEPVDRFIRKIPPVHAYITVPTPWMRKLSAPRACAPRLLRLLADFGITGASMFPGHDGVVRAIKERVLWDKR